MAQIPPKSLPPRVKAGVSALRSAGERLRHTVRREANRSALRLANGVHWLTRDPSRVVGQTPFTPVLRLGKLTVRHYQPPPFDTDARRPRPPAVPVLFIPPLMVRPFIFDLTPSRSFVRTLLDAGFHVYLLDFGEPDLGDRHVSLDDYVLRWIPAAVEAVRQHSGQPRLSLLGYCMGGLFALMYTSVHRDEAVNAIVTIGSPVDSHQMGVLARLVRLTHEQLDYLTRRIGNVPGPLSSLAFRMVSPLSNVTRYTGLVLNLWNESYVDDFDALGQWTGNFIDYPGKAFRQLVNDFLVDNKLKDGRMVFGGEPAELSRIRCPLLAFAGADDQIVPTSSVEQLLELVSSEDKDLRVVPGGHMGMFGGRKAPRMVWQVSAAWLARRSGPLEQEVEGGDDERENTESRSQR